MPVQALYSGSTYFASVVQYAWTSERLAMLVLECPVEVPRPMTYESLLKELKNFCSWQLNQNVAIGLTLEIAEILTLYHEFDLAAKPDETLMLVSTPPDEYFESQAA